MGIKRIVDTAFWTDGKVDEFSPEDKYFWLYLLTNPFTKQLGIYEISIKQAAFQMGYSVEAFSELLERFENKYKMILFSQDTSEIAILNYLRHSVVKGGKPVEDCIRQDMANVKNKNLIDIIFSRLYGQENLNTTVKAIVESYITENRLLRGNDNSNDNQKDNDKDNDNDRMQSVSCNDSLYDTSKEPNPKKNSVTKAEVDKFFESVWTLYPIQKGKQQVSDTNRKILWQIGYDEIVRAINRYLQELQKDASWRTPQNGSTFFNFGYVDYLDKNYNPDAKIPQPRTENRRNSNVFLALLEEE